MKEKGLLIPLSIPLSFYEDLMSIKGSVSWGKMVLEGYEFYKLHSLNFISDRKPERNEEIFKELYKMQTTSVYISSSIYNTIVDEYSEYNTNFLFMNFIYFYCVKEIPSYEHDYFNDNMFEKVFSFSQKDYVNAYEYCLGKTKKAVLTQRQYDEFKKEEHPTLYNIRKKFGSFSKFIEEMKK